MPKPTTSKTTERKPTNAKLVSTKLTDLQRTVLSSAAQRTDGAAALPERITGKAAQKLAATLIEKGLVREVRAKADMPVWRSGEEGRAFALIITKVARDAVKSGAGGGPNDVDAAAPVIPSIPSAGPSETALVSQPDRSIPRQGSKLAEVIALLGRKGGVGIEELTSTTGWLAHTTRAALTGLRKRGFAIERLRLEQGGSIYRIVLGAAPALVA